MELTRRTFLAGAGAAAAAGMAGSLSVADAAWADGKGDSSGEPEEELVWKPVVCEGCPGGCTVRLGLRDGAIAAVAGDPDCPLSGGKACLRAQGLAELQEVPGDTLGETVPNPRRLARPLVRRPGADSWEEIPWDTALAEIAEAVKRTRDETFVKKEGKVSVMRTEAIASFGGAHLPAEEQYLVAKALRGWGAVAIDSEIAFGRRAFTEGVAATCGIDVPDGSWANLACSDVVLTVGSDHAASQPLSAAWARRAQERGATWIVVDPLRTRTAEMADVHVPIRPGTDIAFFGGLVKYIMEQNRWQPEYVLNYTNASYLLNPAFSFDGGSGLFFGWNPVDGAYDRESWGYQIEGEDTWNMRYEGEFAWVRQKSVPVWAIPSVPKPRRNITLQDGACVWARMQQFYGRYDLDTVSALCGVDRSLLESVYDRFAATGTPEGAGAVLAGPGLVQHATGAQAARAVALVQLLLGNMGVAGGGVSYLGGGSGETAAALTGLDPTCFPGGLPWPTEQTRTLQKWLETHTEPAGSRAQNVRALVPALKEWWGEAATFENDYGFKWLPKRRETTDFPLVWDALAAGTVRGCFLWGADLLAAGAPGLSPASLSTLEWLVTCGPVPTETVAFWQHVEEGPASVATTVYQLPAAWGPEKDGIRVSGGRWMQYAPAAVAPFGESRPEGAVVDELWRRVRNLYDTKEDGVAPEPVLRMKWDYDRGDALDVAKVAWAFNGYAVEESDFSQNMVRLAEGPQNLKADGSVACAVASFAGCWNSGADEGDGTAQPVGRRDGADEGGLGLYAGWGFSWPGNCRVRGNRASANLAGQPWVAERTLVSWDGEGWVLADGADFAAQREGRWVEPDNQAFPGVWEQVGLLFSDRLADGPMPEHYEAMESPLNNRVNSALASPVALAAAGRVSAASAATSGDEVAAALAATGGGDYEGVLGVRSQYPIGAVVNGGACVAVASAVCERVDAFEPGFFVEVSERLGAIKGLCTGDRVRVFNDRGSVEAPVLVTARLAPFPGSEVEGHYVMLNGVAPQTHAEAEGDGAAQDGDSESAAAEALSRWAVLAPAVASPVGGAADGKGFLVDIEKVQG